MKDDLTTPENITFADKLAGDFTGLPIVDRMCVLEELTVHLLVQASFGSDYSPQEVLKHFYIGVAGKIGSARFTPKPRGIKNPAKPLPITDQDDKTDPIDGDLQFMRDLQLMLNQRLTAKRTTKLDLDASQQFYLRAYKALTSCFPVN